MDTRIAEFNKIKITRYVPELDLLSNPVLNAKEKEFLADFYDFLENKQPSCFQIDNYYSIISFDDCGSYLMLFRGGAKP